MLLNKDNIPLEDIVLAEQLRRRLVSGERVFGNVAQGLILHLENLIKKREQKVFTKLDWETVDTELEENIAKTEAGIKGEQDLADYLTRLLRYDDNLNGLIVFASLSYDYENNEKDYIPDSDFLIIHGRRVLIIDAKNIKTHKAVPITFNNGNIETLSEKKPKILVEGINSSVNFWKKYFNKINLFIDEIDDVICIVNNRDATIYYTDKLIHISQLREYLNDWVNQKPTDKIYLDILSSVAKTQVKKELPEEMKRLNLKGFREKFNL